MPVNSSGQFTGKWLFDAVILTAQTIDSQNIMYASLTGTNLSDLFKQEFADAPALDQAAAALAARYGAPPAPIQVVITLPWLTYSGYYAGKLTDGQVSPSGTWDWSGSMGWNSEGGPFSVTIDLGQPATIGSVTLIVHSDQLSGVNWPDSVSAAAASCPPQNTGITGQASLASQPVTGGADSADTSGSIAMPMYSVTGQYVTITGTCSGWCLFDEMEVLSPAGTVISTGDSYTVTPMPTNGPGGGTTYGDDGYKLTDGAVIPVYGPQFADAVNGVPAGSGGTAQATWTGAHSASPNGASTATIWMTAPNTSYGVILPASVTIAWRNASGARQAGTAVTPKSSCGPSPCATLTLPSGAQVTGVKATLAGGAAAAADWYMISEISTQ